MSALEAIQNGAASKPIFSQDSSVVFTVLGASVSHVYCLLFSDELVANSFGRRKVISALVHMIILFCLSNHYLFACQILT